MWFGDEFKLEYCMYAAKRNIGAVFRWSSVLALIMSMSVTAYAAPSSEYVLRIEMAPAVCMLDPSQAKQRKCLEGYSFVIKGLYPETVGKNCTTNRLATLPPLQARAIARVMPNESERLQLWRSVGQCVDGNASQYFRRIATYAERLNIPHILTTEKSHYVSQQNVLKQFHHLNPQLPKDAIRLSCQQDARSQHSILTEIQICYHRNGSYKSCSTNVPTTCPSNFVIEGTY